MKCVAITLLALLVSVAAISQRIDSVSVHKLSPDLQEEVNNYLRNAKKSRNAGLIFSIAGGSLLIAGAVATLKAIGNDVWFDNRKPDYSTFDGLIIAGGLISLASIPFYINIKKNRQKARAIVFADRGVGLMPQVLAPGSQSYGIKFHIPLGK